MFSVFTHSHSHALHRLELSLCFRSLLEPYTDLTPPRVYGLYSCLILTFCINLTFPCVRSVHKPYTDLTFPRVYGLYSVSFSRPARPNLSLCFRSYSSPTRTSSFPVFSVCTQSHTVLRLADSLVRPYPTCGRGGCDATLSSAYRAFSPSFPKIGSRRSMHGFILTYSRILRDNLCALGSPKIGP